MNIDELYTLYLAQAQKITTDTRKISKGQIYFALKGANFDGNSFALEALKLGARYAVVDDIHLKNEKGIIYVEDVLTTLQDLALYHRQRLNIPILAITGSNGKTTTKELIKEVLQKKFKVAYTKGNLNNHIGIPLTLLDIKAYEDIAIIEMGANHVGEIASYCRYIEPNYGLITNIGKAHLEGFGGIEGVIKGKTELYDYMRNHQGIVFVNQDDELLTQRSQGIKTIRYSVYTPSEYSGEILGNESGGFLNLIVREKDFQINIKTQLVGDYNASNVMSAYAIGRYFEIPPLDILNAIENYTPTNSRSQKIDKETHTIILDAYNANPSSMKLALENLSKYKEPKIAILGAMKELGNESQKEHEGIVHLALNLHLDKIILVGAEFSGSKDIDSRILYFDTSEKVRPWYEAQNWCGEVILMKGSRGVALERILVED